METPTGTISCGRRLRRELLRTGSVDSNQPADSAVLVANLILNPPLLAASIPEPKSSRLVLHVALDWIIWHPAPVLDACDPRDFEENDDRVLYKHGIQPGNSNEPKEWHVVDADIKRGR